MVFCMVERSSIGSYNILSIRHLFLGAVSSHMEIRSKAEVFEAFAQIMERHGVSGSPEDFHAALNVAFHEYESEIYDQEHADMWRSLPEQFRLLANDANLLFPYNSGELHLLDIGCGTGLATDCLLKTHLGERIESVDLLDTSPSMLRRALERSTSWRRRTNAHQGLLDSLSSDQKYDVIITCSVLHHLPDLAGFLNSVRGYQAPGGVFIHLQDPNSAVLNDPQLQQRIAQLHKWKVPDSIARFSPKRIAGRIYREVTGKQRDDYLARTNRLLLRSGIVKTPLTIAEIFAITDIHAVKGRGISIERMKSWMPDYECVSQRSYGHFGVLWSDLPAKWKPIEEQMIRDHALNGSRVSAVWKCRA